MIDWKQRYPRLGPVVVDGILYVAAYLIAFHLVLILKGLICPPVAWGAVNVASSFFFPVAFLLVGYYRGGWRIVITHIIVLLGARLILGPSIADLEKAFGHERAFSVIWPRALPWIACAGFALTVVSRAWEREN